VNNGALLQDWVRLRESEPDPAVAFKVMKRANGVGEYFLAMEIAEKFLDERAPPVALDLRVKFKQQLALALARGGFVKRARILLEELQKTGTPNAETLGLLGSINKVLASKSATPEEKTELLNRSREYYRLGFTNEGASYCGINAAALSVLLDDMEQARSLAEATLAAVPQNDDYWDLATTAEANLILGRVDAAREDYKKAYAAAIGEWANLATTRRQCRLLCSKLQKRRQLLDDCFPMGAVAFFSGHRVDASDRIEPRFPTGAIPSVVERIKAWLKQNAIRFTYSSAAPGGDILFLECAQAADIETHVLLPFELAAFIEASVAPRGPEWVERFSAVLRQAASVTVLNEGTPDLGSSSFDFTNRMICARATALASIYDTPLCGLALWNGEPGDGAGGTADAVAFWRGGRAQVDTMHPTLPQFDGRFDASQPLPDRPFKSIYTADPGGIQTTVASLLYLQIRGYRSLREKDFGWFFQRLLGGLSDVLAARGWRPARYGFGGDYLFVWNNGREAGLAALEFLSVLTSGIHEFPATINFSICLHSAPMQMMVNPILNQYTHEGAAVSRLRDLTANLSPGVIYATEPFADLIAFNSVRDFTCEYSGTVGASANSAGSRVYQIGT
jgi:tetratricopeptide (TPR) repeat protein